MKSPSFLCNHCGAEAKQELTHCASCGVRFSQQVHCSQCHYEAEEKQFHNGCPKCGYMSRGKKAKKPPKADVSARPKEPFGFSLLALALTLLVLVLLFSSWLYINML